MDKVLVEVFVPVLDHSFDVFIPLQSPMFEVLELIKKAIAIGIRNGEPVIKRINPKDFKYPAEEGIECIHAASWCCYR